MARPRTNIQIDWGLFLLVVVVAQGFSGLIPGHSLTNYLALSAATLAFLVIREPAHALAAVLSRPLVLFMFAWYVVAAALSPRPGSALLASAVLILMVAYVFLRQTATERTLRTFALGASFSLVPSTLGLITPLGAPVLRAGSTRGYAGYFPWNSWAGLCAAAAIVSIAALLLAARFSWWQLPAIANALLILVLSDSATSKLVCIAALGVLLAITAVRRTTARTKPLVIVGLGAAALLAVTVFQDISIMPTVAEATGRDEKFTRRTDFWQHALKGISESPYWGHGSAYWDTHYMNSAHNGFLDFALFGGLPAALALVVIVISAGFRLIAAESVLLSFWTFGVVLNLAISQLAVPTVASLALWIAIASTARHTAETTTEEHGNRVSNGRTTSAAAQSRAGRT